MGQATVDLPDPLQTPPVSAANTDDLLAQLAGEEIDRLLAEADSSEESSAPSVAPNTAAQTTVATTPAPAAPPPSASAATAESADISAELDDLLGQLEVSAPSPVKKAAPPPVAAAPAAAVEPPPVSPKPAVQSAAVPEAEVHPVAAELDEDARMNAGGGALSASVIATAKASVSEVAPPKTSMSGAGLPLYLKPLEWISAPLDACSDQVRETIGKIAILTTVNALSVLAYVVFFRGH